MSDLCPTCLHAVIQPSLLGAADDARCTHPASTTPAKPPSTWPSHLTTRQAMHTRGPCAGGRLYERRV